MVGVTLAHRKGYFRQVLDAGGNQTEQPEQWDPAGSMELMEPVGTLEIEGREVRVRAWRYLVRGCNGHTIPVYLLDTNLPENSPWDRTLTDNLYGGDIRYRFCQETVLGIGGVRMLRMLEHATIRGFHMNEGHSGAADPGAAGGGTRRAGQNGGRGGGDRDRAAALHLHDAHPRAGRT